MERYYLAIDLKSFYASAECAERGLDAMTTHLVVADESRTEKTICLAVSPALKSYGVPGRARLFEAAEIVEEVNKARLKRAPQHKFTGKSHDEEELKNDPSLALDYVIAPPRMALYMAYSRKIYSIYLKYVAPEDIHAYSVDEVFMDVTNYLKAYGLTPHELAIAIIRDVLAQTGITATAGIGANLYLAKVAMDIVAKHLPADMDGVRIAELDEAGYRKQLWSHRPLTDFWRVGRGYSEKLEAHDLYTMGDVARCSLYNEDLLYRLFGVNAELLIDHAWGWEPCTIAEIKAYKPRENSISSGQVLKCAYSFEMGKLVVREMTDLLALDLVEKGLETDRMTLTVGYDIDNMKIPSIRNNYRGEVVADRYGRAVPKSAHGSVNLGGYTSSTRRITEAVMELYERIVDKALLVRRMYVVANHIVDGSTMPEAEAPKQLDLFTDYEALEREKAKRAKEDEREHSVQEAVIAIHKKFGKNALVKGMNLEEGATTMERNGQIGGHKK